MTAVVTEHARPETWNIDGTGLLVPSLQAEAVPIRVIRPAPCTQACPAGVNVKAYVSLIAEERFGEALEVIRQRCPLPGICGRVCHHPCEAACERGRVDEPIAIRSLKRFVADLERGLPPPKTPQGPERPQRVAVIGSGPAGLAAAYDLCLSGYPVTVFESEGEPGGMLRYGITAYRLPRDVLDAEIEVILQAGVNIQTGRRLGVDMHLEDMLGNGFSAVLLAVGAQIGRKLSVPGAEQCPDVEDALEFLRRVNAGDRTTPGRRVVVIGGGSTAVEAARTALRLGARSVDILYRRFRQEFLAADEEVDVAEKEGIGFRFLVAPARVQVEAGRLKALECLKVGLGEPDASGRRQPILIPGSEFTVAGRPRSGGGGAGGRFRFPSHGAAHAAVAPGTAGRGRRDLHDRDEGCIRVGGRGHRPGHDCRGDRSRASRGGVDPSLHRGGQARDPRAAAGASRRARARTARCPADASEPRSPRDEPAEAGQEVREVEQAFTAGEAVGEARRCLRCGPCGECRVCARSCQRRHIMVPGSTKGALPGAGPRSSARRAMWPWLSMSRAAHRHGSCPGCPPAGCPTSTSLTGSASDPARASAHRPGALPGMRPLR